LGDVLVRSFLEVLLVSLFVSLPSGLSFKTCNENVAGCVSIEMQQHLISIRIEAL